MQSVSDGQCPGDPLLAPHPHPCPHAGRHRSCQAGTRSPGRPNLRLSSLRGWSQGGEFGKLVNSKAQPPLPPPPCAPPPPRPAAPFRRPSLSVAAGDKGQAEARGCLPPEKLEKTRRAVPRDANPGGYRCAALRSARQVGELCWPVGSLLSRSRVGIPMPRALRG